MSGCYSTEVLEQVLTGDLDESVAAPLRAHLATCATCQGWLDARAEEPALRACLPRLERMQHDVLAEPALQRLLDGLRSCVPTVERETRLEPPAGALPFLNPPAAAGELGRLGPYRIVAELGRGGMGIVFRAVDDDLRRTVALKVLRPDLADEEAKARLVREAQLAARFRHEHVIGVHAVVQPPGGLPYLVMEYVDGQPLSAILRDQKRLEPRQAVEWLVQAADGLAAAHAAGLVHRDVKPGNILIEKATGKAKLGDFGLARAEAHTQTLTQAGAIMGTPVYMSPEQARAAPTDPRTDVYSLGVTLYEVLTGEVPFRGTALMVVRQILTEEPRPPRRLNDHIPRDLETICLKAMAKEPARRYANAGELADDLRRWQRGETIRARPAGPVYRAWRWCRRRPLVAGLAAALLLTFVGGFAAVFAQWRAAVAARDAEATQRERAEKSYRLAREALDRCMELKKDPRLQEGDLQDLQTKLAEAEKTFYEQFVQIRGDDPDFQFQRAVAFNKLGSVTAELGQPAEAVEHFRQALDLLEALTEQHPEDWNYRDESATVLDELGKALHAAGRSEQAGSAFQRAIDLETALIAERPAERNVQQNKAIALHHLGNWHRDAGRLKDAEDALRQAVDLQTRLVEQAPEAHGYLQHKAAFLDTLADVCARDGRPREAEGYYKAELDIRRRLSRDHHDLRDYQYNLGVAMENYGVFLLQDGRAGDAAGLLREAAAAAQDLVRRYPRVLEYQRLLGAVLQNQGTAYRNLNRTVEAEAAFKESIRVLDQVVQRRPTALEYQATLALTCMHLGFLYEDAHRWPEAEAALRQALELQSRLVDRAPHDHHYAGVKAAFLMELANLYKDSGRLREAEEYHQAGLEIRRRLSREHPDLPDYQDKLGLALLNLGNFLDNNGHADKAEELLREGVAVQEDLVRRHPLVLDYQSTLAGLLDNQGLALEQLGRAAEAEVAYKHAIRIEEQLVHRRPTDLESQDSLANACNCLGRLYNGSGRSQEAEGPYRRARDLWQTLADQHPDSVAYQNSAAMIQNNLALVYQRTGRWDEAEAALRQALRVQTRLVEQHPKVAQYTVYLGNTRLNMGTLVRDRGNPTEALTWYAEAIPTLEAGRKMGGEEREAREFLCEAYYSRATALTQLGRHAEALADWDCALKVPPAPDLLSWLRRQRACTLARLGKVAEARAVADELAATGAKDPKAWYEAACVHAVLAVAEGTDPKHKEEGCVRALELLTRAEAAGYFRDPAHRDDLKKDADLNSLRARDDFQKLQKAIEKKRSSPSQ
jgi:tetratricopeptide (TPR) repeat protein